MEEKTSDHIIVAVHITNRLRQASEVQNVLTEYGLNIKTRVGLHEATQQEASPSGVIILEMVGEAQRCHGIIGTLDAIEGVEAKSVVFEH
jgi:hypothetical protein